MIGKLLLTITFLAAVTFPAFSQTLPGSARSFIDKHYPDWSIAESWKPDGPRTPAIVSGDFNGDRVKDYAVLLKKDDRTYLIVLIAKRRTFEAVNLLALGQSDSWVAGISSIPKGRKTEINDGKDTFRKIVDAVEAYDQEGRSAIFFWEKGKFQRVENTY